MAIALYALADSATPEAPRYVGITKYGVDRRMREHVNESLNKRGSRKRHWIRSVTTAGRSILVETLETYETEAEALQAERNCIRLMRACGARLVNSRSGGQGTSYHTDESKQKISQLNTGRRHTPESRAKMRAAHFGKKYVRTRNGWDHLTPEQRANRLRGCSNPVHNKVKSETLKRLWARMTAEERAAFIERRRQTKLKNAKPIGDATCEAISKRQRARFNAMTLEQRANATVAARKALAEKAAKDRAYKNSVSA